MFILDDVLRPEDKAFVWLCVPFFLGGRKTCNEIGMFNIFQGVVSVNLMSFSFIVEFNFILSWKTLSFSFRMSLLTATSTQN